MREGGNEGKRRVSFYDWGASRDVIARAVTRSVQSPCIYNIFLSIFKLVGQHIMTVALNSVYVCARASSGLAEQRIMTVA